MNSIILYKAPWTYGDSSQPYFTTEESRDLYFETLDHVQVNVNNPNIKISFNYSVSLKVDLDINIILQYNYVVVEYNGKKYYGFIMDCEHISINYSRIEIYRHALAEIVDCFSYFKNYRITRATFSKQDFSNKRKISYPKFRFSKENYAAPDYAYINVEGIDIHGPVEWWQCLFVYCYFPDDFDITLRFMRDGQVINRPPEDFFFMGGKPFQGILLCFPFINYGSTGIVPKITTLMHGTENLSAMLDIS